MVKADPLRTAPATILAAALAAVSPASAQAQQPTLSVIPSAVHDQSPPLSVLAQLARAAAQRSEELEVLPAPRPAPDVEPQTPEQADPVVQDFVGPPLNATDFTTDPDDFVSVEGIAQTGSAPPDTNGAIGATQYLQFANSKLAVFDKATGALLPGYPIDGSVLFSGMGLPCESNRGDGVVLYDRIDGRFVFSQLVSKAGGGGIDPFSVCIAVSTTSDAAGTYNRYLFDLSTVDPPGITLNDYPKFGAFPAAYFYTANSFGSPAGTTFCAFDRVSMVQGIDANAQCFFTSGIGSYLPADLDGTNLPPDGSTGFMLHRSGNNALGLRRFHVDFSDPTNTTLTDPPITIAVPAFSAASGGVPQLGTAQRLDALGDRLMFRLAYRNFGDHESLVANHSVNVSGNSGTTIGIRWYEIQDPNGSPFVFQQGTYAPDDGVFRWMGSIAMDQAGDIAVGYSASSADMNPSIWYTGRTPTDPPGILEAEAHILDGTGSQTGLGRWGDYSALTVDPVDDCTFWFTTEYHQTDGGFNWHTRIANFSFAGCGGALARVGTLSMGRRPAGAQ